MAGEKPPRGRARGRPRGSGRGCRPVGTLGLELAVPVPRNGNSRGRPRGRPRGRGGSARGSNIPTSNEQQLTLELSTTDQSAEPCDTESVDRSDGDAHVTPCTVRGGRRGGRPRGSGAQCLTLRREEDRAIIPPSPRRRAPRRKREEPPSDAARGDAAISSGENVADHVLSGDVHADVDEDVEESGEHPDLTVPDDGHPWNSPEGFPHLMEQMKKFYEDVNDHGHVCSICGERKFTIRPITAKTIQSWYMGAKSIDELRRTMYPQFPDEKSVPAVRR